MRYSELDVETQEAALLALAKLAAKGAHSTDVRKAALQITADAPARDDIAELEAIYDAVQNGTDRVPGMEHGIRYVSDPYFIDYFTAPARLLQLCDEGACAEDCDGHAAFIAALALTLGYRAGLRIFKPKGSSTYTHVYAVVGVPKRKPTEWLGMDTTVPSAGVGWEPPGGQVKTMTITP